MQYGEIMCIAQGHAQPGAPGIHTPHLLLKSMRHQP